MVASMEKRIPHYPLKEIKGQMQTAEDMKLTISARQGMNNLRMTELEVVKVVQGLGITDFYKSMTTYSDHRVWQDVYRCTYGTMELYIKFQKLDKYFVISFKGRTDG